MEPQDKNVVNNDQQNLKSLFAAEIRTRFGVLSGEITQRNSDIEKRDQYVYSDKLEKMLDIPVGHDFTPVNWLRRTVEIHKNMFMSRGFQVISTYDTQNEQDASDDSEKGRMKLENAKAKTYAEARKNTIDSIMRDNGGSTFWATLAENASAVGTAAIKAYYDEEEKKYELCEIEAIENLYALWSRDDFREVDAYAFAYQVSKQEAISDYGAPDDVATSPMGQPLKLISDQTVTGSQNLTQPMVTILEVTGKLEGWASEKGQLKKVNVGSETELNALIVGEEVTRLIDDAKKLPKYYLLPNKRQRRRPWGMSDITDAAININLTYIETLSDWRTHASKVNFQKYKAYGFGGDTQLPKSETRKIQIIPLADGQDMQRLDQGDSHGQDFLAQMGECKEQFVRETGISRVLFDDPTVTLNSNQALLTSMKPTSDIAEAKKQLWAPIIMQIFQDALEVLAQHDDTIKEIADPGQNWYLKVMWPSVMQKEDPVYQQMLLNRFNAGTMSVQSYLEAQGETKEEVDRLRDEIGDPVTAAILAHQIGEVAKKSIFEFMGMPPWGYITPRVQLRGELAPQEVGNMAHNYQWDQGPYGPNIGPQGFEGAQANQNFINNGFVTDTKQGAQANYQGPQQNPQGGAPAQVTTPANNTPGAGVASQPGSGATTASAQGALTQQAQNQGK